ncbi:hypothetical protein M885DRAFT_512953 [Pelagophyceae sp. CCMP2097]|nr:hypothetical protein M885DRAFT_512953 [Pelagophyceae sp. CCMP2097]
MVVLSAAICTKAGRTILARQFVDMNRLRIEGLLAAFPKLCNMPGKQHTYIETDAVRYVYQPLEGIYLLLITNKASNIVEDLETLRLLSKVVPEIAGGITEEKLAEKCFELVFAFDEVITTGGYREAIDMRQIRQNLEMDSHEEKLHNMVKKTKMDTAKDQAAHMSKVIRERQKESARTGMAAGMAGIGGGSGAAPEEQTHAADDYGGAYGGAAKAAAAGGAYGAGLDEYDTPPPPEPVLVVKSMKLGLKGKSSSLMDAMAAEDNLGPLASMASKKRGAAAAAAAPAAAAAAAAPTQPVSIVIEEKISCALSQEGTLESFEVKGMFNITANDEAFARCKIMVPKGVVAHAGTTFQVHPKVAKQEWERDGALMLKDGGKGFPVGRAVGVLRWSLASTDDAVVPIVINCWPEDEGDQINVNIEYTLQREIELHNVQITIPLGCAATPQIVNIDGQHHHDAAREQMVWQLPMVDGSNRTGTLEFNIASRDASAFFPITLAFTSKNLYYDIAVTSVNALDTGSPITYSLNKALSVESFRIQ